MSAAAEQKSYLPIVFAADGNFSVPLAIAVESLLVHARPETRYDVYVLDDGVQGFAKEYLEALHGRHDFKLTYLPVADMVQQVATTHYFPRVSFARFLMPAMLPPEAGPRVFYSDADVFICDDLSDLYGMDMQGRALGAVQELAVLAEPGHTHIQKWMTLFGMGTAGGAEPLYCNSGNLLFDRALWVQRGYAEQIMECSRSEAGAAARFPDQDIMNAVCRQDMVLMPPRYCAIPLYAEHYACADPGLHFGGSCRYRIEELRAALENPALIHFAGQKPRVLEGPRYPLEERFIQFWKQSAWRDYMPFNPRVGSYSPSRFIKQNVPISAQLGVLLKQIFLYRVGSLVASGSARTRYLEQYRGLRRVLQNARRR